MMWEVRLFYLNLDHETKRLPDGWEPFAAEYFSGSRIWAKREIREWVQP